MLLIHVLSDSFRSSTDQHRH